MKTRRKFTDKFKAKVVARIHAGEKRKDILDQYHLASSVLAKWVATNKPPAKRVPPIKPIAIQLPDSIVFLDLAREAIKGGNERKAKAYIELALCDL